MRVQIAAPINTGSVIYNKDLVVDPIFSSYMDNLLGFGGKVTDIRQFINAPRPFRYRTYEFDLSNHSKELTKMYDCSCEGILGRFLISSEGGILFELSFSVENNDSERIAE